MITPPKLLGRYSTPAFSYGDVVPCARRGDVRIVGDADAPIPWPIGQTLPNGRARALVLFGDLAEAVRRESAEAVMHFWGVKHATVWAWRKALGVGQYNEGTTKLKSELLTPVLDRARQAAIAVAGSAERREKIAASKRGKPRPPHVGEAMRKERTGKPHTEEARAKMSQAQRARPRADAWSEGEDELARALRPEQAAEATGRTLTAVYDRRRLLGLPDGRADKPPRGKPLSEAQIRRWARAYREASGRWPSAASPAIGLPDGESWKKLDTSLRRGQRGLPGDSSLSRLLRAGGL